LDGGGSFTITTPCHHAGLHLDGLRHGGETIRSARDGCWQEVGMVTGPLVQLLCCNYCCCSGGRVIAVAHLGVLLERQWPLLSEEMELGGHQHTVRKPKSRATS
jgi:hypothetical protein